MMALQRLMFLFHWILFLSFVFVWLNFTYQYMTGHSLDWPLRKVIFCWVGPVPPPLAWGLPLLFLIEGVATKKSLSFRGRDNYPTKLDEKRPHQLPDRAASPKNSFIPLARSLGTLSLQDLSAPDGPPQPRNVTL